MTPALLFPAGLAALAALAVPLAIHLAREAELRRTDFAALRWLAARPRPRTRRRFDEWLLLATRLTLLALVALWLARPAVFGAADTTPYVAVVPGVDIARLAARDGERRHWLAPGFPPLDAAPPVGRAPVASLIRELDAALPPETPLRLIVPPVIDGADAERPRLSRTVTWQVAGDVAPSLPGTGTPVANAPPAPPALSVRFVPSRASAVRYFRAAAAGWAPPGRVAMVDAAGPSAPLPAVTAAVVWLVPGPLPPPVAAWVRRGGTALTDAATVPPATAGTADGVAAWRDAAGLPLATAMPLGRGHLLRLTRPLDPAAFPELLEPAFPQRLRTLLAAPPRAPARVAAADFAPLSGAAPYPLPPRDLRPWLAVVIAAAFLAERLLATTRRVRAAP